MGILIRHLPVLGFICLLTLASSSAAAQACLPSSPEANNLVAWVRHDVGVTDSADLVEVGLLPAPPGDVVLVTADSVCTLALTAFNSTRQPSWDAPPAERVYVISAGASRFVVVDPAVKAGEWVVHAVFDENWQLLAHYGG